MIFGLFEMFCRFIPNNYSQKAQNISKNFNLAEVLIFGNSHTFYGMNPKYFLKPTFNISNVSQTLYFDNLLFENFIDKFTAVKTIVLNVDYFTLSEIDNCEEDNWRKYYYEYYYQLQVPTINKYNYQRYLLSATRDFNSNLKLTWRFIKEGTIVDCDELGFGNNYTFEKKGHLNPTDIVQRAKSHEDSSLNLEKNKLRLQKIIAICKAKKIKVILVTMPVMSGYSAAVNQNKLATIVTVCKNLEVTNSHVYYLNLFRDTQIDDTDFFDADHLHNRGAAKCSIIVNDYITHIIASAK